jgi:hypothetical protein
MQFQLFGLKGENHCQNGDEIVFFKILCKHIWGWEVMLQKEENAPNDQFPQIIEIRFDVKNQ